MSKIQKLREKIEQLEKQIYHSPYFYTKYVQAKKALKKELKKLQAHQTSLQL